MTSQKKIGGLSLEGKGVFYRMNCTLGGIQKNWILKQLGHLMYETSPEICTMVQSFAIECEMNKHLRREI